MCKQIKNTTYLEMEGHIGGVKMGMKKKKQYTAMTVYGNNTAIRMMARIRNTSYLVKLTESLKEEETMRNMRPTDEEEALIRRLRRYKTARYEAIMRLKKGDQERGEEPRRYGWREIEEEIVMLRGVTGYDSEEEEERKWQEESKKRKNNEQNGERTPMDMT